ncbi:VTT domain-containing protein [Kiritimatiellaeota bacterium B1221]|nr:VTT domain-containing protein [Kiritimatiellaeota bacterium B1221]
MSASFFSKHKRWIKPVLGLILFACFLGLMKMLPFQEWLKPLFDHLEDLGPLGAVYFALIGIVLTICFVPVSVPVSLSGFFFGIGSGFLISTAVLLGGTSLGSLAGRWLWPRLKDKEMFQNDLFNALRKVMEKDGLWNIILLRMSPVFHFMTGNLFLGSLKLPFFRYLFFSFIGMIPGTLLMVSAGHLASETMVGEPDVPVWQGILFAFGVLAFAGVSWRITSRTREELNKQSEG